MSRTYNHKPARVYEPDGLYEYNEDFAEAYHKQWAGRCANESLALPSPNYDVSHTMNGIHDEYIPNTEKVRRHPNKKSHKHSLYREFAKTNSGGTRYWRRPYGEAESKSYRMKGIRKVETRLRRSRQKENLREIINSIDNDLV